MPVQNSTRKWVFIGVGVIAAAAFVVFFQSYPPQPKDAAATIGAAQRYHATQITGADVKVSQDELTTWMQSDTFDRIVKDPQARKLFTDAAVLSMFDEAARKRGDGSAKLVDESNKLEDRSAKLALGGVRERLDESNKLEDRSAKLALGGVRQQVDESTKLTDESAKLALGGVRQQVDESRKFEDSSRKLDVDRVSKLDDRIRALALDNAAIRDALRNQAFCQALTNNQTLRDALLNQARIADTSESHD